MTPLHTHRNYKTVILWHHSQDLKQALDQQLSVVIDTLLEQQYKTLAFTNVRHVSQAVLSCKADLLLIHLPSAGEKGYALCRQLRQQSAFQHLPVVFIGGTCGDGQARIEALRCGGSEYLPLPVSSEECWLSLKPHLAAYQLVRRLQGERLTLSQQVGQYSHLLAKQERLKASLAEENQALHKLAFVDGLTGVSNRRQFDSSIAQLWENAYQQRQPLSLIMCDVDYFKAYNDTYGHLAGDACLRSVATALTDGTRRWQDLEGASAQVQVARYGGEEFAILLPNTDAQGAKQVACLIQAAVDRAQIPHKASSIRPQVTLSIGVHTLVPAHRHQTYERLIYGADKALYTAKLRGRDRIITTTLPATTSAHLPKCAPKSLLNQHRYLDVVSVDCPSQVTARATPLSGRAANPLIGHVA